jgi:DNA adenine methylase
MGKKILPFRWYGGKYSHLDFILPQLPQAHQYVEPFGGSAAVLINRDPSPVETYNDLDGDVVTFFRVLREDRDKLLEKIALTPFSREELAHAVEKKNCDQLSDIEQARLFFVRAGQTRSGLAQEATPGRWAYCKSTSRRNMSGAVSRWHGRLEQLHNAADRLRRVQIENKPATEIIQRYDDEDVLFYCDPPYVHESRGDTNSYGFEMTDEDHRELAEVLQDCEGKVAVSGYQCELYEEIYEEQEDWKRIDAEEKTMHTTKDSRQESIWVNYQPPNRDDVQVGAQQQTLSKITKD